MRPFRIFHLERLKDRNGLRVVPAASDSSSPSCPRGQWTQIFFCWMSPTANLDFAATQQLKEILLALKKQGKTLLLSEHRLYYLADIADEFLVMAGRRDQRKIYCRRGKGVLSGAETNTFSGARSTLRRSPCRRKSRCLKPRRRRLPSQMSAIHTAGRPEIPSLVVSFSVREHEIVGLVGANGCGKTTIGKLIAGLYRPSRRQDNAFRKVAKSKAAAKASAVHPSGGGSSSSSQAPSCTNCNTAMR